MKKLYLISITTVYFLIQACGQPSQNDGGTKPDSGSGGINHPDPNPKEVTVEYRKDGQSYSLAVDTTKDLPACEHANNKQLAWVKSTNQFFSCEDTTWTEVIVKGETGPIGPSGNTGPKGDPASPNQWFDPITKLYWLIGAIQTEFQVNANVACGSSWTLPTKAQASSAVQHGLLVASSTINGPSKVWTSEFSTTACAAGQDQCRAAIDAGGIERYAALATNAGVLCLAQ